MTSCTALTSYRGNVARVWRLKVVLILVDSSFKFESFLAFGFAISRKVALEKIGARNYTVGSRQKQSEVNLENKRKQLEKRPVKMKR